MKDVQAQSWSVEQVAQQHDAPPPASLRPLEKRTADPRLT